MRIREIKNSKIRESALRQYADQIGINQDMRFRLLDCYLSLLDYSRTIEGFDYWNTIRPLYLLNNAEDKCRQVYTLKGKKYYIADKIKRLLKDNKKPNSYLWKYFNFNQETIEQVLKGGYVGIYFVNLMCLHFKVDKVDLIGEDAKQEEEAIKKPKQRRKIKPLFPKGTKRVCKKCKIKKDLATEFNNFQYGVLGKRSKCKICTRAKQREYRNNKKK